MSSAETIPETSAQFVARRSVWNDSGRASTARVEQRPERGLLADEMAPEEKSPALVMVLAPLIGLAIWARLISLVF